MGIKTIPTLAKFQDAVATLRSLGVQDEIRLSVDPRTWSLLNCDLAAAWQQCDIKGLPGNEIRFHGQNFSILAGRVQTPEERILDLEARVSELER